MSKDMQHIFLSGFLVLAFGTASTAALALDKAIDEAKCAGIFMVNKNLADGGKVSNGKSRDHWESLSEQATALAFEAAGGKKTREVVEEEIGEISTAMGLALKKEDPETLKLLNEATPRCEELIEAARSSQ